VEKVDRRRNIIGEKIVLEREYITYDSLILPRGQHEDK
jgi:hypothetical protein